MNRNISKRSTTMHATSISIVFRPTDEACCNDCESWGNSSTRIRLTPENLNKYKFLRMKKDRPPLKEKAVADPLITLSNKIRLGGIKQSAKELLMPQLSPPRCQIDFLPAANLGRCNALDYESMKEFRESCDADKGNGALGNNFDIDQKEEEEAIADEEKEVGCIECLMNDLELSCDGEWLRNHLRLPLKTAMKEIVAKKPGDPVNYLGFWLLHYRKCIERNLWQSEKDRELEHYRSLVQEESVPEEEHISERGEEEELARDSNFKYYESTQNQA